MFTLGFAAVVGLAVAVGVAYLLLKATAPKTASEAKIARNRLEKATTPALNADGRAEAYLWVGEGRK